MARLRGSGHQAYLVGGAVRDLLLGGHPKDFDIATDATPETVHALFRNSRIIGRRFRIVHVRFGREIIEVTTFRGHHDNDLEPSSESGGNHSRQSASGLLLRDNVYGTLEEDAVRRDLTVNALYYDSGTFEVFDHVHGLKDLERRSICIIGEPAVRFTEDPVRMLRVLRFAAKLEFKIDTHTARAIPGCAHLLAEIPAARLFDEFLKLFLSGYAAATFDMLIRHKLMLYLFPDSYAEILRHAVAHALVRAAMASTDQRIAQDKPVTPAFILAALLWPVVQREALRLRERGDPPLARQICQQARLRKYGDVRRRAGLGVDPDLLFEAVGAGVAHVGTGGCRKVRQDAFDDDLGRAGPWAEHGQPLALEAHRLEGIEAGPVEVAFTGAKPEVRGMNRRHCSSQCEGAGKTCRKHRRLPLEARIDAQIPQRAALKAL